MQMKAVKSVSHGGTGAQRKAKLGVGVNPNDFFRIMTFSVSVAQL